MSAGVEGRIGQVWEVVGVDLGPWLVVGYSPDLFGVLSWELASLSTGESGTARVLELSLLSDRREWQRLL